MPIATLVFLFLILLLNRSRKRLREALISKIPLVLLFAGVSSIV